MFSIFRRSAPIWVFSSAMSDSCRRLFVESNCWWYFFQIFDGIGIVFGVFVNVSMLLQAFLGQLVSVGMGLLILFVQYVLADVGYQ